MVVVTGATGHIGNALVRELIAEGFKVRAVVLPSETTSSIDGLGVEYFPGDVRDYRSLIRAFQGAQTVFHLAGIVSIGSGRRKLIRDVNVQGTINVCDACRDLSIRRLVYVSSIHAFREPPKGTPISETKDFDPRKVRGIYAKSKAEATKHVLDAVKEGLDAVIVHPTGVIGPYEFKLSNMGQLFIDFMKSKLYAIVEGSYDFVDVRDVARGILLASKFGRRGENYILSGEQVTVRNIMDMLESETGIAPPRRIIPVKLAMFTGIFAELYYKLKRQQPLFTSYSVSTLTSNSLTNSKKANAELGYIARPLKESIRDTLLWLKRHFPLK